MDLDELAQVEQLLRSASVRVHSIRSQLDELEHAISHLGSAPSAFRLVGGIMVQTEPAMLRESLAEQQDTLKKRLEQAQTEERRLRDRFEEGKKQVLEHGIRESNHDD